MGVLQLTLRYKRRLKAAYAYQKELRQTDEFSFLDADGFSDNKIFSKCRWNRFEALKEIVEDKDTDINIADHNENTTLMIACQNGHEKIVEYLLRNFGNELKVNAQNKKGQTALHFAHYYKYGTIARMLIKHGADTQIKNSSGLVYLQGLG